jgi:hypothetical protein
MAIPFTEAEQDLILKWAADRGYGVYTMDVKEPFVLRIPVLKTLFCLVVSVGSGSRDSKRTEFIDVNIDVCCALVGHFYSVRELGPVKALENAMDRITRNDLDLDHLRSKEIRDLTLLVSHKEAK